MVHDRFDDAISDFDALGSRGDIQPNRVEPAASAQVSPPVAVAMTELMKEAASYPRGTDHIRRTLALVLASVKRLEEMEAAESPDAASFSRNVREAASVGPCYAYVLGSGSLDNVRRDLADALQQFCAPERHRPVEHLMGAVAIGRNTMAAVLRAIGSASGQSQEFYGEDPLAHEELQRDLAALTR